MIHMHAAGLTDIGKRRSGNEDTFAVAEPLLVVADGMGGAAAGEVASAIAVETLADALDGLPCSGETEAVKMLARAIITADCRIKERIEESPALFGMGTTIVAAYVLSDRLLVGNVGDSRAYLVSGLPRAVSPAASADGPAQTMIRTTAGPVAAQQPTITRITEDDSVVMGLVKSGIIAEEDIRSHPLRNRITKCAGCLEKDDGPVFSWHDLSDGDVLLLCSDGLWGRFLEDVMRVVLASSPGPGVSCRWLVVAAGDAGGADNITVIVARFTAG